MTTSTLQPTSWLAKRLGLSASTIERLRARGEGELPPHITVGLHTIRYDTEVVEAWLAAQQHGPLSKPMPAPPNPARSSGKKLFKKRLLGGSALA